MTFTLSKRLVDLRAAVTRLERIATKRLEVEQTPLRRRNARRDMFGAIKSTESRLIAVKEAFDEAFPGLDKKPVLSAEAIRIQLAADGDWRKLLNTLPWGRLQWNRPVAEAFIEHWATVNGLPCPNLRIGQTRYWWENSEDEVLLAIKRKGAQRWPALMGALSTITVPGPRSRRDPLFAKEILRVFQEFAFFRQGDPFHLALRASFAADGS